MPKGKKYNTKALYFSDNLNKKLDEILSYPVTLIEAPMGYGKTTAIKEYLTKTSIENYWLNIHNSSLTMFWNGFSDMISKIDKVVGNSLNKIGFPSNSVFIEEAVSLINKIQIFNSIVIVIDDYHLVTSDSVDDFFNFLFKNLDKNIHIVITSRVAINMDELKLKRYINHISKDTLELNVKDIEKYFLLCGMLFDEEDLLKIYKYSEGWISALYLFMLNYAEFQRFDLTNNIYQLVTKTVYNPLSDKLKEFLYYICIFENFSLKQIQYIYGNDSVSVLLDELMQKNAFIRFDYLSNQYHLHNIFSNCILIMFNNLDSEFKNNIYIKAGFWYVKEGKHILAMEYFYKAKDFENLLITLQKDMENSKTNEYKQQLIKYITESPNDIKKKNHLAMLVYLIRLFTYNEEELFLNTYKEVVCNIEDDSFLNQEDKNQLLGESYLLLSFTFFNDIKKMSNYYKKASSLMKTPSSIINNAGSWAFIAPSVLYLFYREKGKLWEEVEVIKEAMPYYSQITGGYGKGAEYVMEAEAYFNKGDIDNSEIAMYKALAIADEDLRSGISICAVFLQIRILLLKGNYDKAINLLLELREKIIISNLHMFIHTIDLCDAYIYSSLSRLKNIPKWIASGKLEKTRLLFPTVPVLNLVYCRVLLVQGEYTKLIGFSQKAITQANIFPNQICHIYVNIHVSAALDKLYKRDEALSRLKLSLDLANDDMLYMPFVENCDYIYPLLEILSMKGVYKDTVKKIFKLFDKYKLSLQKHSSNIDIKELSKREYEVAELASKGLTNKEISEQLFISVNTVKATLKTIFKKLSIKSRAQLEEILQEML